MSIIDELFEMPCALNSMHLLFSGRKTSYETLSFDLYIIEIFKIFLPSSSQQSNFSLDKLLP